MAQHVCPWWLGYVLINPFRKLNHPPEKVLAPHISEGMTVLETGPGMGYFTLPMARIVGYSGKIICVDIQEKMLSKLTKRAEKNNLSDRIQTRLCSPNSLNIDDLNEKIDFAFVFAVVHETPDPKWFLTQICKSLKPGGKLLFSEPKGHVSKENFDRSTSYALENDLIVTQHLQIKGTHSIILSKKN